MKSVLIVGATGHFGTRICRRIVNERNLRLFVSSRSLEAARKLADELASTDASALIEPVELNQDSPTFSASLGKISPDTVLHTAGPYQGQGYSVARACLENGCHYIDLADGREFVSNFGTLNAAAADRNLFMVSGASTLPGLSSVVVSSYVTEFSTIESIETTIAPAHQTPRGLSTIAAVMSYCGQPFSVLEDGEWRKHYGWQDVQLERYPSLGRRLAGACDVPDLTLFPAAYPSLRTASFHAALEAPWEQLALWMMAAATRVGLVRNWAAWAPQIEAISQRLMRLGSDRGGMSIRITGIDKHKKKRTIAWNLEARSNHGPEIPCTPALILLRKLLRDELRIRGAMPCLFLFTLEEIAEELREYDISWSRSDQQSSP